MNRFRNSYLGKSREASTSEKDENDLESTASTIVREEPLKPPSLKMKRVDWYYSRWSKSWKYRNTSSKVVVETVPVIKTGDNDQWKDYSFVVVRTIPRDEGQGRQEPTFKVVVKSEYLLKALKDVVVSWVGVSWNAEPLELEPEIFLTFYDEFVAYRDELQNKKPRTEYDSHVLSTVNVLLSWLDTDYSNTLARIKHLKAHGEMTFDLLYSILAPRSLIVTECAVTAQPRIFKLISTTKVTIDKTLFCYQLNVESIDLIDRVVTQTVAVGKASTTFFIQGFKGTVKINSLDAYPIKYHPDPEELRKTVIERGNKWKSLIGIHHVQFDGIAALKCQQKLLRHNVKGRIMVDRASFKRWNANYQFPTPVQNTENTAQNMMQFRDMYGERQDQQQSTVTADQYANGGLVVNRNASNAEPEDEFEWTDEALILTSTLVHGFSLSDKMWLEFDVTKISDIVWNEEAFKNLVLPSNHKTLLQSLVEAHHRDIGFDDFIRGKGHGLVILAAGPPGVGKTFSAEATSEHVRKPLYLIGAGDLGIEAGTMDTALDRVFQIATTWKAIVLIDEADVFLEQRSLHELQRNAMVAVFLRHVEYYRGILFLTTNRVTAFDEAFLSRIHVALHFTELPVESRAQVWKAFIAKAGEIELTEEQLQALALRNVNGRQIKNAARTAQSLATGRGEKLNYKHFVDTLDAMHDFTTQFENMNGSAKPGYYS